MDNQSIISVQTDANESTTSLATFTNESTVALIPKVRQRAMHPLRECQPLLLDSGTVNKSKSRFPEHGQCLHRQYNVHYDQCYLPSICNLASFNLVSQGKRLRGRVRPVGVLYGVGSRVRGWGTYPT